MASNTLVYFCTDCGNETTKWQGKCPACSAWNTLRAEPTITTQKTKIFKPSKDLQSTSLKTLSQQSQPSETARISTGIPEVDRVLGGGVVTGSLILLGGDPGIGKSTIALQVAAILSSRLSVLYVSAEESAQQIALRAQRLQADSSTVQILATTTLEDVIFCAKKEKIDFIILDSIQTINCRGLDRAAGSITQVRTCTNLLQQLAKQHQTSIIIIGHVTKDGSLAGPKTLEHLVDVVLYLEGDDQEELRLLRSTKNRFGRLGEVGVFSMEERGLQTVTTPESLFCHDQDQQKIGSILSVILEGERPFIIEIQALVVKTSFGYPRRTTNGFDQGRLDLLVAVLNKYTELSLDDQDIYINIVGGLKTRERAVDLAVCLSIASSLLKIPLSHTVAIGEIDLSGKIRTSKREKRRLQEIKNMNISHIISASQFSDIKQAQMHLDKLKKNAPPS